MDDARAAAFHNTVNEAYATAAAVARDSYGRLLALLATASGDIIAAEDALAHALERALRTWPDRGVPNNPDAWILTVARNRLRDHWKSAEVTRTAPLVPERHVPVQLETVDPDAITDKRLELMLVCAHPAIDRAAHTPLMLNTVLGFTAAQIASAFHLSRTAMATRLVRVKKRIKTMRIPFVIPDRSDLRARLPAMLQAIYGAYAIEWATLAPGPRALPPESLQLVEILADLLPKDPEVRGLAALVLLSEARRGARCDDAGRFVPLDDQDPARWDAELIARAHEHLRAAHAQHTLGRFQLEAAIQAAHCARHNGQRLDWHNLKALHEGLQQLAPTLGNAVALAAVTAKVEGPQAGIAVLDALASDTVRYQPAWATRAHLLSLVGRKAEAAEAYSTAISLSTDPAQRTYLERQQSRLLST